MTPTGSNKTEALVKKIELSLDADILCSEEVKNTARGEKQLRVRKKRLQYYIEAGESGDIETIIATEKAHLRKERIKLPGTSDRISGLNKAIVDMEKIESFYYRVRDPDGYQILASGMEDLKQWDGDLPKDSARLAFKAHYARLGNTNRNEIDEDKIPILEQRQANMKIALDVYKLLQKQALGPVKAPKRDLDNEMGMGL